MKHIMKYEGFSTQERQDGILDKISKYGIESLTLDEKEFLDSFRDGSEDEFNNKLNQKTNTLFEDDYGLFKFEFKGIEKYDNETHIIGTIYVPDISIGNQIIKGKLDGCIIDFGGGKVLPDFFKKYTDKNGKEHEFDIFEFCSGVEYELDSFIDYIIIEIEKNEF